MRGIINLYKDIKDSISNHPIPIVTPYLKKYRQLEFYVFFKIIIL